MGQLKKSKLLVINTITLFRIEAKDLFIFIKTFLRNIITIKRTHLRDAPLTCVSLKEII